MFFRCSYVPYDKIFSEFFLFFKVYLFLRDRDRQSVCRGGAEREGDTESEAGSGL